VRYLYTECSQSREQSTCELLGVPTKREQVPLFSRALHRVRTGSIEWRRNRSVPIELAGAVTSIYGGEFQFIVDEVAATDEGVRSIAAATDE